MLYEEYEKILTKGVRVDWYGEMVPEKLITSIVKEMANNITETIDKYEALNNGKNPYVLNLKESIKVLPYRLNGDFYLIKKSEIEDKMKQKPSKTSKKVVPVKEEKVVVKRQTKNSSLIFGNKK